MPVLTEQRDRTLLITLDRPEKMNALNQELMEGLAAAWRRLDEDESIWVAILTGAGDRAFCSGRDLFAGTQGSWEYHREQLAKGEKVPPRELRYTPDGVMKPVIAAVNGYSLAGGFALALACDLRIAADTARLGSMAVKRNLLGGGQIVRLTRYVPFAKALELLLLGDHISAAEAERIGLVNKVVSQAELLPTAFEWAEKICANGPLAVRSTKEVAYRGGLEQDFRSATRMEGEAYNRMLETEDVVEGHAAFRERREPVWKGR